MVTYRVVGVMSGTSLDGMDVCCVDFTRPDLDSDSWTFKLIRASCYPYSAEWRRRLSGADGLSGEDLIKLHIDYSHHIGQTVRQFIAGSEAQGSETGSDEGTKMDDQLRGSGEVRERLEPLEVELCACHGHTVFHQPQNKFTFQLGDSETIATYLKCPVVANFRSRDVALGGQGAPLVPVGERHLFPEYEFCLNLGGIVNISCRTLGLAFDVGPCNMLLNTLATRHDPALTYDRDGQLARCGLVDNDTLIELAALEYYRKPPPKSLGKEWFDSEVEPIINRQNKYAVNLLRTSVEHIAGAVVGSVKFLIIKLNEHEITSSTEESQIIGSSDKCSTAVAPANSSCVKTGSGENDNVYNSGSSCSSCIATISSNGESECSRAAGEKDKDYLGIDSCNSDQSGIRGCSSCSSSSSKGTSSGEHNDFSLSTSSSSCSSRIGSGRNGKQLKMLITGGGAHNGFLVERIKTLVDLQVAAGLIAWDTVMDPTAIDFKEATVFAFHGLRRLLGLTNVDKRATGATADSIAGCMSLGTAN